MKSSKFLINTLLLGKPRSFLNRRNKAEPCKRYNRVTHCIFDLDGAVLDNQEVLDNANKGVFEMYQLQYTPEWRYKLMGRTEKSMWEKVIKDLEIDATWQKMDHEYLQLLGESLCDAPLRPGIDCLLEHLQKNGIPMAAVTSSPKPIMERKTKHIKEIMSKFEFVVCADDHNLKKSKPSGQIYSICRGYFTGKPDAETCLVFENTKVGVLAAMDACMQVVGVCSALTPKKALRHADEVIEDLSDFQPGKYGMPPIPGQFEPRMW